MAERYLRGVSSETIVDVVSIMLARICRRRDAIEPIRHEVCVILTEYRVQKNTLVYAIALLLRLRYIKLEVILPSFIVCLRLANSMLSDAEFPIDWRGRQRYEKLSSSSFVLHQQCILDMLKWSLHISSHQFAKTHNLLHFFCTAHDAKKFFYETKMAVPVKVA